MLDQRRLIELLKYVPEDGTFFWRNDMRGHARAGEKAGCSRDDKYIYIGIDGTRYYAHRLAWLYVFGKHPDGQIDYIDHDPSNNAISNLRLVTVQGNRMNVSIGKRNRSGVIGVYWAKHAGKWSAQIRHNKHTRHLGYFDDISRAIEVRKQAEKALGFHQNHGGIRNGSA